MLKIKKKTREFLESLISLNKLNSQKSILKDFIFKSWLKYEFDSIAGGLQDWLENTYLNGSNIMKFTKIKQIIF